MLNKDMHSDKEKFLNEVLKTEPQFSLPDNFAEIVTEKVSVRFAWQSYFKEFLIYLAAVAGILLIAAIMSFIWFVADLKEWWHFIQTNISWVTGIAFLAVFILFADRVLLRYLFYKTSAKTV